MTLMSAIRALALGIGVLGAGLAGGSQPAVALDISKADVKKGKKVFRKCAACHTVKAGKHRVGPSLHGIVGRKAGTTDGFKKYSKAMKAWGQDWTVENIDAYLANPKKAIPGNKMAFAGLKKEADRINVIGYLAEQK